MMIVCKIVSITVVMIDSQQAVWQSAEKRRCL